MKVTIETRWRCGRKEYRVRAKDISRPSANRVRARTLPKKKDAEALAKKWRSGKEDPWKG